MDNEVVGTGNSESKDGALPFLERRGKPRIVQAPAEAVSFGELWRVLHKRRWIIWTSLFLMFGAALGYTLMVTPRYKAASIIEFHKSNTDSLDLDERADTPGGANAMDYGVTQRSQVSALSSDTLALQVVQELNLEGRKEFAGRVSLLDYFRSVPDESKLPLEKAPYRMAAVLKAYHKNLTVERLPGTRMISIEFLDPDPQVAANVVNNLVNAYREQYFRIRYAATVQASDWLSQQLESLRTQVETSQKKVVDYQRQAGILGTDEKNNVVMTRLQQIDSQLTTARANRILAEAVWQLARNGNPELLPGLVTASLSPGTSTTPSSLALLETLRSQENQLKMQYAADTSKYGSAYPKVIELQNKLREIDASIQTETANLADRARNAYTAAIETQNALEAAFEKAKQEANQLNNSAVQYTLLKNEAEASRNLYDSLSRKLKEAGVLANLRSSNIVVVDPARPAAQPARPIVLLNLGLGLLAGLLFGVVWALVAENLDETISSPGQAEEASMAPSLGFVPRWKRLALVKKKPSPSAPPPGLVILRQPHSHAAETYRSLRTSIIQSTRTGECNVLLVTSPFPGDGKTSTAMNCAAAFAQQGTRVLLVEADLRRPKFCSLLNQTSKAGFSVLIAGGTSDDLPLTIPGLSNLEIIPAGPRSASPAELLGSPGSKAIIDFWRKQYDYIFIDTPPILSVTDAAVVAPYCDGVILVARSGVTTKKALMRAVEPFRRAQTRIVGTVLNAFDVSSADYKHYFGYTAKAADAKGYYIPEDKIKVV
jgi:succinoglycan biosynthesis transport protein ExoP